MGCTESIVPTSTLPQVLWLLGNDIYQRQSVYAVACHAETRGFPNFVSSPRPLIMHISGQGHLPTQDALTSDEATSFIGIQFFFLALKHV
jgi:hypothetical protein